MNARIASVLANEIRARRRPRWLPAILLSLGCFLSQSFPLPLFGWSFLLLFFAWTRIKATETNADSLRVVEGSYRLTSLQLTTIVLLVAYLATLVSTSTRLDSVAYLLSSMACAFFSASIILRRPDLIYFAVRFFLVLNVMLLIVGAIAIVSFGEQDFIFVLSDTADYFRFRGLSLEPNHLGLSLNAIYIFVLFSPRRNMPWQRGQLALAIATIWCLTALTVSMFAVPCMVLTTLFYGWTSTSRKFKSAAFFLIVASVFVSSERFERTISAEDNSANLRTWGALVIAQAQVDKCGLSGCGLGSARTVLSDELQMRDFAAQESLGLPNLFAAAMVEGGYFFAGFFFLVILLATLPFRHRRDVNSWRCRFACFSLLFLYAITGSFPYDAHFLSIVGLFYVLVRTGPDEFFARSNFRAQSA